MKRLFVALIALLAALSVLAQSTEIAPNENLIAEGIPKIPASIAEAVRPYTEVRTATFDSWHPVRREMLIGTRFGDTLQIHMVRMPGGDRRQLTFFAERAVNASFQPTKGDFFLFSKDIGGGEFFQIYRYEMATGAVTLLTDGKSQNGGWVWSRKGDRIAYGSTRRNGQDRDLYVAGSRRCEDRPPAGRALGRRMGRPRLVPGRPHAARRRGDLGQRDVSLARRRRHRAEDPPDAEGGTGEDRVRGRAIHT